MSIVSEALTPKKSRVLIADDHKLISDAVGTFLTTTELFSVQAADTFGEAIKCLEEQGHFDIVMLDLVMPGLDKLEDVRKVVEKAGTGQVVLFSANVDLHMFNRAVEMGVRGLIPKNMPLKSLVSVLRLVESGQLFVPNETMGAQQTSAKNYNLSEVELYVLRLVAIGLTNKHIANDLDQNETAVKMHMRSICRKLGARNRAHAAMIARDKSIIEISL